MFIRIFEFSGSVFRLTLLPMKLHGRSTEYLFRSPLASTMCRSANNSYRNLGRRWPLRPRDAFRNRQNCLPALPNRILPATVPRTKEVNLLLPYHVRDREGAGRVESAHGIQE